MAISGSTWLTLINFAQCRGLQQRSSRHPRFPWGPRDSLGIVPAMLLFGMLGVYFDNFASGSRS